MKLKVYLSLLLLFLSFEAITQVKPFRFGVRAAPNLAWISPDSEGYVNKGVQVGFSWGFLADITLTQNYFIKTGFNLDYLNGKLEYPHIQELGEGSGEYYGGYLLRKYKLRYLEFPVTLKMRTNQFGNFAFYGEIGFGASFNLKARGEDEFDTETMDTYNFDRDIKDEISLFNASLIAGAGIEYFIDESTSLVGSITFHNGLTNILKGENTFDTSIKQRANLYYFNLNIGILF